MQSVLTAETDHEEQARSTRWPGHLASFIFPALIVIGLVLRVLAMRSTWAQPDGDEAMGMLMAVRASHGSLSLLFWGGNYGGAVVTWIEAPFVLLFGDHVWIFQVIDTLLAFVCALLLRSIGRHVTTPIAADVAAGTFWFFPALWIFWSSREYVFWLPAILFAFATCLLTLRWFDNRKPPLLILIGLSAGLSVWSYPLVISLLLPALAVLVWVLRRSWSSIARIAVGGLIGVSPWLAYFAWHGRSAFGVQAAQGSRTSAAVHSITQVLPTALIGGQKRFDLIWQGIEPSPGRLAVLGISVYLAVLAFTVYEVARRNVALAACGATVVLWPIVLAVGHVPVGPDTYRYGLIVTGPILLVVLRMSRPNPCLNSMIARGTA